MQVLDELEADGQLVLSLKLTPSSLPDLVEHNPAISFEVPPLRSPAASAFILTPPLEQQMWAMAWPLLHGSLAEWQTWVG